MKRNAIERMLPAVFQRAVLHGTPLDGLLAVMEALHEPSEEVLASIDEYFNPYRTADAFVPYLAQWVDLLPILTRPDRPDAPVVEPSSGLGRLRELIASAGELAKWRGTARGLTQFLGTATGERGILIDEHPLDDKGRPRPCHLRITAPASCAPHRLLIERIVEVEKPAYTTCEIVIEGQSNEETERGTSGATYL
jgi:phage tail-like protein